MIGLPRQMIASQASGITTASPLTWIAAAVGLAGAIGGVTAIVKRTVIVPWLKPRFDWRWWGPAQIMVGGFLLLESIPRLASASRDSVVVLTNVGLVLLAAGLLFLWRSQRRSWRT